ncbi:hypothetical protein ADICYQ_1871 [Cyclobacterium qasimii M12-11B]|uniref:Uncharacterized protein n=1 Tax=Cyclobacterium qasimii M12-11B TaxID=641524 RepID=S7WQT5_9BACT|nr:hypothetical protein ADICYQ_1871 [Cyclobacterium qasimii M12-11B]
MAVLLLFPVTIPPKPLNLASSHYFLTVFESGFKAIEY